MFDFIKFHKIRPMLSGSNLSCGISHLHVVQGFVEGFYAAVTAVHDLPLKFILAPCDEERDDARGGHHDHPCKRCKAHHACEDDHSDAHLEGHDPESVHLHHDVGDLLHVHGHVVHDLAHTVAVEGGA